MRQRRTALLPLLAFFVLGIASTAVLNRSGILVWTAAAVCVILVAVGFGYLSRRHGE